MAKAIDVLLSALEIAAARGVSVCCSVSGEVDDAVAERLRDAGVELMAGDAAAMPGLAVFDEELIWYGSLPLLAFPKSDDCSVRFRSAEVAFELLSACGLDSLSE